MDILRGFAFTKPSGLIVDMFQFTDDEQFLELNAEGEGELLKLLERVVPRGVRMSPSGCAAVNRARFGRNSGVLPVVHCDNESSRRYTIVEIIAEDALGLLCPRQPRDVGIGCRSRPRAYRHGRSPRDRRLSSHSKRREAHA